jgi:hypothetical protein
MRFADHHGMLEDSAHILPAHVVCTHRNRNFGRKSVTLMALHAVHW